MKKKATKPDEHKWIPAMYVWIDEEDDEFEEDDDPLTYGKIYMVCGYKSPFDGLPTGWKINGCDDIYCAGSFVLLSELMK